MADADFEDFFGAGAGGGGLGIFPVIPPNGYWSNQAREGADTQPPGFLKNGDTIYLPNSDLVGTNGANRPLTYYSYTGAQVWSGAPSNVFGANWRWVSFMMDTVEDRLYFVLADDTNGQVRMGYAHVGGIVGGAGPASGNNAVVTSNPSYYWGGENAGINNPISMHRDANGSGGFKVYTYDRVLEFDASMNYVGNTSVATGGDNRMVGSAPVKGFIDLFWHPYTVIPAGSSNWESPGLELVTVSKPPTGTGHQTATIFRGVVDQANGLPRLTVPGNTGVLQWGDQYLLVPSNQGKVYGFTRFDKVEVDDIIQAFCQSLRINDDNKV